jgi:hypothetical protein
MQIFDGFDTAKSSRLAYTLPTSYSKGDTHTETRSDMPVKSVVLILLLISAANSQNGAADPVYQNWDPPNCGTFRTGKIYGVVKDQLETPLENAKVVVFDEVSRKVLWRTATDQAGRFSISHVWPGRLRIVFYSPGFRTEDWVVTMMGKDGAFRPKAIPVVLPLPVGDTVAICRPDYSR